MFVLLYFPGALDLSAGRIKLSNKGFSAEKFGFLLPASSTPSSARDRHCPWVGLRWL
jgi:hypothetical protein